MNELADAKKSSVDSDHLSGFLDRLVRALKCPDCPAWMATLFLPEVAQLRHRSLDPGTVVDVSGPGLVEAEAREARGETVVRVRRGSDESDREELALRIAGMLNGIPLGEALALVEIVVPQFLKSAHHVDREALNSFAQEGRERHGDAA